MPTAEQLPLWGPLRCAPKGDLRGNNANFFLQYMHLPCCQETQRRKSNMLHHIRIPFTLHHRASMMTSTVAHHAPPLSGRRGIVHAADPNHHNLYRNCRRWQRWRNSL